MSSSLKQYQDNLEKWKACKKPCETQEYIKESTQLSLEAMKTKNKKNIKSKANKSKTIKDVNTCTFPKCKDKLKELINALVQHNEESIKEYKVIIDNLKKQNAKYKSCCTESQLKDILVKLSYLTPHDMLK